MTRQRSVSHKTNTSVDASVTNVNARVVCPQATVTSRRRPSVWLPQSGHRRQPTLTINMASRLNVYVPCVLLPICELDYSQMNIQPCAIHMYPVWHLQGEISIPHGRYRSRAQFNAKLMYSQSTYAIR